MTRRGSKIGKCCLRWDVLNGTCNALAARHGVCQRKQRSSNRNLYKLRTKSERLLALALAGLYISLCTSSSQLSKHDGRTTIGQGARVAGSVVGGAPC